MVLKDFGCLQLDGVGYFLPLNFSTLDSCVNGPSKLISQPYMQGKAVVT